MKKFAVHIPSLDLEDITQSSTNENSKIYDDVVGKAQSPLFFSKLIKHTPFIKDK